MRRPIMVDLYCCQGGATKGYERAGFDVIGVDLDDQPNYPGSMFIKMDALTFLARIAPVADVAAYHASPPCQHDTLLQYVNDNRDAWPDLISPTRELLAATGKPYVIENVLGARKKLIDPVTLCGEMFGLGVIRHRLFETNWQLAQPAHVPHRGRVRGWRHGIYYDGPYVAPYGDGGGKGTTQEWADAMGIDWMTRDGLREAIPPAYSEYVGTQLLAHLQQQEAA